ncbi:thiol:disulfide interchange protein DsbD [Chitinivorax tropicus]|uniref:Thiol:disulfide interchange protein DsbD n=1 Tax=Chitinivorax tropicus TaxID=714531 RepID=A0A840MKR9_9PROT|nr:protein-disulfide reductase DsbD [Chitinivorax tropicus]MBB5017457.1 thiol:disulfide interchange protein DsbD [Chitinivorax tropicus]
MSRLLRPFIAFIMLCSAALTAHAAGSPDLLPPEQAFAAQARLLDPQTVEVSYHIASGYYMYRERFKFKLETTGTTLGEAKFPPGKIKQDDYFGQVETYRDTLKFTLPLAQPTAGPITLKVTSQGCADAGVCYPPYTHTLKLSPGSASPAPSGTGSAKLDKLLGADASGPPGAQNPFASKSLVSLLGFFFLAGLGLAFTACMYPLIPILSGIIVGQGKAVSKSRGFLLSMLYVQGMALAYALAGVAAGLTGTLLSNALQKPWVLGLFSIFFVIMAGGMFGLYQIQLPSGLQSRLSDRSNRMQGGHYASVFGMGILSALIVGPCVAPPLAMALGYIGATRDVVLGGSSLYAMALGMGTPLIAVGVFGGHILPRAGAWMNTVKAIFGTLMLAVAIWIATPILPPLAYMLSWSALLIISAIYLHALDPLPSNASGWRKLWKGVGVIALLGGSALLLGALAGNRDVLQPLKSFTLASGAHATAETSQSHLAFKRIGSVEELDQALADHAGKRIMLDFYADWCVSCKEMERFTFTDQRVTAQLKDVVLLQADVTDNTDAHQQLLKRFGLFGPPGIIFFNSQGQAQAEQVIGFQTADQFLSTLSRLIPPSSES